MTSLPFKSSFLIIAVLCSNISTYADASKCSQALKSGDFDLAQESAKEIHDFDGLLCLGRAYIGAKKYEKAIGSFEQAYQSADNSFDHALAQTYLARSYKALKNKQLSIETYKKSIEISKSGKSNQIVMTDYNELGMIHEESGNLQQALESYLLALDFAANDNERSECNQNISSIYYKLDNVDRAIEYQLRSVILESKSGELDTYLKSRLTLGQYFLKANDYRKAEKEFSESIEVSRLNKSVYWEAKLLLFKSKIENAKGNMTEEVKFRESANEVVIRNKLTELYDEFGVSGNN